MTEKTFVELIRESRSDLEILSHLTQIFNEPGDREIIYEALCRIEELTIERLKNGQQHR